MSLLDGEMGRAGFLERLTLRNLTMTSAIAFVVSLIGVPLISFGAFTARDEHGWIMGFVMLLTLVCLGSGLLLVVLGIVALRTRKER